MRVIVLFFLISGMLSACGGNKEEKKNSVKGGATEQNLNIVSTIKPVQMIVAAIAGDKAESYQLIPDNASPHNYSFKPSDIRKLKQADVIFRIDEHMEAMLTPAFENVPNTTPLVSLAENSAIRLLEVGEHHDHGKSHVEHKRESTHDDHGHENHDNVDFHIWTSPQNAQAMASAIAKVLIELDPENKSIYQRNLKMFVEKLKAEVATILVILEKQREKEYIVFHDSWQYFAQSFKLQKPTVVSLNEGFSAGAKTIALLKEKLNKDRISCVFYDPTVAPAQLALLRDLKESVGNNSANQQNNQSSTIRTIELDVLGQHFTINKNSTENMNVYIDWLRTMANQVNICLGE